MFRIYPLFQHFNTFGPFSRVYRKVTVESKTLPVEAGRHHGQNHGRRPHQRNDPQSLTLGNGYHIGSRVGHRRTTGLRNHTDRHPLFQRVQIGRKRFRRGVLPHGVKSQLIYIDVPIHLFQKTTGRTQILHDEMPDVPDNLCIIIRQNL